MQSACAVLYCNLWPVWIYHISQHYLINGTIFGKTFLNIKGALWFSLQLSSETFLFLRRIRRENPSSGSRVVPSGRTDGRAEVTKQIVAFGNFSNAPKHYNSTASHVKGKIYTECVWGHRSIYRSKWGEVTWERIELHKGRYKGVWIFSLTTSTEKTIWKS